MTRSVKIIGLLLLVLNGCEDIDLKSTAFQGTWTIEQVYANDHWGAPLYWRDTGWGKQIKFTADKYYEKIDADFELIGTYRILPDGIVEFTYDTPLYPEYPTFEMHYEFDGHRLTLFKNQFEGIVGEKYRRTTTNDLLAQ